MRSFLLAATVGAAASLAVDVTHKSKKSAIEALMQSASTMLKDGATPAVIDFAEETLGEIGSTVIPNIVNESLNDQRFIDSLHNRFEVILAGLETKNQEIHRLNAEEQQLSTSHKECRGTEDGKCQNKRGCEMELHRLWTVWVEAEEELKVIHDRVDGHFCPPDANGTLHTFRVASVPMMQQYMEQKIVVDAAEAAYDNHVPLCATAHEELNGDSARCNAVQGSLEEMACQRDAKIREVLTTYYNDHAQAVSAYNCAVEEIMQLERDRKREWTTLQVVNCLLERIREQNGVPCDSAGDVTDAVGICEERHSVAVCSTEEGEPRLCLTYPPEEPHPEPCAARDQVIGRCLPARDQHLPCSGGWHNQEYAGLPGFPIPPFSETNPGCNAYPECVSCPEAETPTEQIIDSCPGYTADGCARDGEEGEHPLTFVRNVDGVADVRCCSIDGATCQSKEFEGGVDFDAPNGNVEHGCYFQVTYQEALSVCHAAGMRMCSADEVETCCGSGCWHNHNAVWVDVAPVD